MVARRDVTGLVLAGGNGQRLGGVDKGLQRLGDRTWAQRALDRLAPQVGRLAVNANRHLDAYRALGVPVWPDATDERPGPLAGVLAGLRHSETPWVLTVPCDTPDFPLDLAARLAQAVDAENANVAIAATRGAHGLPVHQPVFMLAHASLADALARALDTGERQVVRWALQHGTAIETFDDAAAFANLNTPEDVAGYRRS